MTDARATIIETLEASELDFTEHKPGVFEMTLPGERKLQTTCRLEIGAHALGIHAFVCRKPDENHRGGLPLAAGAQPQDVRASRSPSTPPATSTSTAALPLSAITVESSTGCSAPC